jgi:hypothetical protein
MGIELVECPDERVVGVKLGVLAMEQEREPVSLVAVKRMVTA